MKRSQVNAAIREASAAFKRHGWALPPEPRWDVTDFGLGDFRRKGLILLNLAEEPEYCEKLMYARKNQVTCEHYHAVKKEDIICRFGRLAVRLFPARRGQKTARLKVSGRMRAVSVRKPFILEAGERVTLARGVPHAFWPVSKYCIIGEVSTANDDLRDNFFRDRRIGRFGGIVEDERAIARLVRG